MEQVIDHAEKLYGKPRVIRQNRRQTGRQLSLAEKTQDLFGLEPGIKRATFIPTPTVVFKDGKKTLDWTDWTAPEILYGLAKTFTLPEHARKGGSFTHQDTVDAASNLTGGGFLSGAVAPKVTTRGAAVLGMGGARTPLYKRSTSSVKEIAHEINKVLETKNSSKGKVFREDLGEITIDFGNSKKGLKHIIKQRTQVDKIDGDAFVREQLPRILSKGKLKEFKGKNKERRAIIETPNERVILSLMRDDKKEVWLITGYEKFKHDL